MHLSGCPAFGFDGQEAHADGRDKEHDRGRVQWEIGVDRQHCSYNQRCYDSRSIISTIIRNDMH